jgi:hypothetical protein
VSLDLARGPAGNSHANSLASRERTARGSSSETWPSENVRHIVRWKFAANSYGNCSAEMTGQHDFRVDPS